jgi:hypothetical protein
LSSQEKALAKELAGVGGQKEGGGVLRVQEDSLFQYIRPFLE